MNFATGTICGKVNWIGEMKLTPTGRPVVNLLVVVWDKKIKTKSTTYKLSVWDLQVGTVLKYVKKDQIITAQGTLSLETYGDKPIIRLDFVSILDYGHPPEEKIKKATTTIKEENIVNLENIESKIEAIEAIKTPMEVSILDYEHPPEEKIETATTTIKEENIINLENIESEIEAIEAIKTPMEV